MFGTAQPMLLLEKLKVKTVVLESSFWVQFLKHKSFLHKHTHVKQLHKERVDDAHCHTLPEVENIYQKCKIILIFKCIPVALHCHPCKRLPPGYQGRTLLTCHLRFERVSDIDELSLRISPAKRS
jgi:hypothetical protein